MSHDTPQGAIRPIYRPSPEILQGVLAELEAAADLVEQLLVHGHDDALLTTVNASLDEMLALLSGGRHD